MSQSSLDRVPEKTAPNVGDLIEDALHQAKSLIQAELSLARRELTSEFTSAVSSVLLLIVGVMFVQATLTTLGVLLVLALGSGLASVAVVVVLAAIAGILLLVGVRHLQRRKLPRTTERLAMDAKQVMETVK
jgi:uncharacterized membrane protein YqjE